MSRSWRAGALLGAILFCFGATPASAALKLCNQTSYVLYAAVGWRDGDKNISKGWTRVIPGDCRDVLRQPLSRGPYYLFARSSSAHTGDERDWGGNIPFCVKDANFNLTLPAASPSCADDTAIPQSFSPVDTHGMASWTTTLTESPSIPSLDDARRAGLDRLLGDLGYKFRDDDGRQKALASFHRRVNLVANASQPDLFDALETEAMKVVSPAGYSICNDTGGVVWTVLGFTDGKKKLSAGWWKVAPGACARALTQPLHVDAVFLHAEAHNKPRLVSGTETFCVANITFQTTDSGNCAAHGLVEVRFAKTNTKGLAGYTAHIGEGGLEPQALVQAVTPK